MSDVGVLITLDDESIKDKAVLDYTSRDFTSIRAQLIGLAEGTMPDWQTAGEAGDFGTLLIELYAYMGDILNFYIDRTASEAFLATAVRPQSVLYIADMLGYIPIGQSAATVDLSFSMDESPDPEHPLDPVTLPRGTAVHTAPDNTGSLVAFEMNHPLTLNPGDKDKIITATEGVTVSDVRLGTAFGVPNAEYFIREKGVIFGSIRIVTQEGYSTVTWSYTSDLSTARATQPVFTTYVDDFGGTHIVFGDNTSGRVPAVNATLYASYRYGVGARANDVPEDTIKIIVPPKGVDTFFVKVTNPTSPIGGSDPESISSMKYTIPRAGARIRSRAVTLNDYADLAMQVPSVSKAVAYGTVYTSIKILVAPPNGEATSDAMIRLCQTVEQYMADKILIGSNVVVGPEGSPDPLFQDVYIRVTVHVVANYNRSAVRDGVDAVITDLLDFDNVDFGTRVSKGAIYRSIMSVQGVEWAEIRWLSPNAPPEDAATIPISPTFEAGLPLQTTETLLGTKWLFDNTVTMADPGAGKYRADVADLPTKLAIDITDAATLPVDVSGALQDVVIGDHILLRTEGPTTDDPESWWDLVVTADAIPRGTTNEVQTLTASATLTSGQFKLTLLSVQTADIAYNATNAVIKAAIDAAIPGNTVTVTGGPINAAATPVTLTYGSYGPVAPATIQAGTTPLVGGTINVATTTEGVGAGWYEFNVKVARRSIVNFPPQNSKPVYMEFLRYNPTPLSAGEIGDILTDELKIPRIETTEVTEDITKYPDLIEEEDRIHDGLWVVAIGGLAGT